MWLLFAGARNKLCGLLLDSLRPCGDNYNERGTAMQTALGVQWYHAGILFTLVAVAVLLAVIVILLGRGLHLMKADITIKLRRQFMDLQSVIARNEDLANLYQRGLAGFTGLSDSEQTRFFIISGYAFTHWSEVQRHASAGLVPDAYWQEVLNLIRDYVQYPGVQEFWNYRRHWFPGEFSALIDGLIEGSPREVKPLYPEPAV